MGDKQKKTFSWLRFGKRVLIVFIGIYLFICGFLFFKQDSLLFHPQPLTAENEKAIKNSKELIEEINLKTADNFTLRGWFVKDSGNTPKPLLIACEP